MSHRQRERLAMVVGSPILVASGVALAIVGVEGVGALLPTLSVGRGHPASLGTGYPNPGSTGLGYPAPVVGPSIVIPASANGSPSPGGPLQLRQEFSGAVAVPAGWVAASNETAAGRYELHAPPRVKVAVETSVLAVISNTGSAPLVVTSPCGNHFNLVVRDADDRETYNWTMRRYSTSHPPCPAETALMEIPPGEGVMVPLTFMVDRPGPVRLALMRLTGSDVLAQVEVAADAS